MKSSSLINPIAFFLFFSILSTTIARDTITSTQPLVDDETLISSGGTFALGFFTPHNSNNRYIGLWYNINSITTQTILWVANRENPVTNSTATLSVTSSGSLTITDQNSTIIWSTKPTNLTNPIARLLDNGNLVLQQSSDSTTNYAWQGFDHPTNTLIPGMKLGVDLTTGLNRTLTSWTAYNDPSPGPYTVYMDTKGDPEIYFSSGSTNLWRSGPWDGTHFNGVNDMTTYQGYSFTFLDNDKEVAYFYETSNQSLVSRLVANYTGVVQRYDWLWDGGRWNAFWTEPQDQCDNFRQCGPYGVCDINSSPVCSCLQGFTPRNPANWNLKDGLDGCARQTGLDCRNGSDGFLRLSNMKLPESGNSTVEMSLTLDECAAACKRNCSCVGYASADVASGSGCVMWAGELFDIRNYVGFGQDLYVRLAAADLATNQSRHRPSAPIAVSLSLVSGVLLLACVGCFLWRRKTRRRGTLSATTLYSGHTKLVVPNNDDFDIPLFDFDTIAASTEHFSFANKLGEGGFGPVYKGKLSDGQEIAVKRLAKTSTQGADEFKNEVILIAKLQHRNLVRLLGCSIQIEERMLIYEYMPNKGLDEFLFGKTQGGPLDWRTRHQIIIGIARGLLYLHQDSRFRIIHRDLKASNILLDKEMNPKISDFGMARILGGDETDFNTKKIVGTYGYMSPEYAMNGVFSVKSDVFSFGVLVLEIISGRKNRGLYANPAHLNLVAHAWSLWKENKSFEIIDESINGSFSIAEVLSCMKVGLLCVQERPEDRPLMSSVIIMLESGIASLAQPKKPGFVARSGSFESSNYQDSYAAGEITIDMTLNR